MTGLRRTFDRFTKVPRRAQSSWHELEVLKLNVKNLGYELAREMARHRFDGRPSTWQPVPVGLVSKPTTQADCESEWFQYWCEQLHAEPYFHRKLWELAFCCQVLFEHGLLAEGKRGVGFGCGEEPLPSLFAARGIDALVTDLAPEVVAGRGWAESGQHASTVDKVFYDDIVDRAEFDRRVALEFVDMNAVPGHLGGRFDFCWSVCAFEHLGSIEAGLRFVERAMDVLKPGGVAIHTTEFNYLSTGRTIDHGSTVLFRRSDFDGLIGRLRASGHVVLGPDYGVGDGPLDRYVDLPPFALDDGLLRKDIWGGTNQQGHLKLALGGFPSTCFGLVVVKHS